MRLRACQEAGLKEVYIIQADQLTEKQQREFIIKDNVGFGEWDWDEIANNFETPEINNWGLDIPAIQDFSEANQEIDIDSMDESMVIKLNYPETEYWKVKEALLKISDTPEDAVFKLLKL